MLDAMNDDFNTPQTIAYLFDLSREVNQYLTDSNHYSVESWKEVDSLYREIGNIVLGVIPDSPEITSSVDGTIDSDLIQLLIDVRNEARKQKQFELSDIIRDRLREIGVILEDSREGTNWKRVR
jgi:cysteinyl-tRNA synthetase